MTLSNQSGITYYRQIADILIARIYKGVYQLGEKIPSGRDLGEEFGCNRHTIRRALDLVEVENLIIRQRGRGTYVAQELPHSSRKTQLNIGLIDISHALGFRPPARVLSARIQPAREIASKLSVLQDDNMIYIHRLRLIDEQPSIVEYIYIPATLTPNLIDYDLHQSLRNLMQEQFNLNIIRSEIMFEPILSSGHVSELLEVPVGSALMLEKRTSFNTKNSVIEYSEHIYRGDRFSFVLK